VSLHFGSPAGRVFRTAIPPLAGGPLSTSYGGGPRPGQGKAEGRKLRGQHLFGLALAVSLLAHGLLLWHMTREHAAGAEHKHLPAIQVALYRPAPKATVPPLPTPVRPPRPKPQAVARPAAAVTKPRPARVEPAPQPAPQAPAAPPAPATPPAPPPEAAVADAAPTPPPESTAAVAAAPTDAAVATQSLEEEKRRYLAQLLARIEQQKHYPRAARRRGIQGEVAVSFRLLSNGMIADLQIGTGPRVLRRAAARAVESALPLPPPPAPLGKVAYAMRFSLQ
jgi:protein TonB